MKKKKVMIVDDELDLSLLLKTLLERIILGLIGIPILF